ncbi:MULTISPECIES: mechanosensitive ion channel family protein [Flavobacteriaceae]|uniref:Mechanosensitive ion channel n=2 Tax=Flavobacteriaceae TaxID=49546 RepID=A0A4Y8AWV4_9FLAO|nr:MULTISPECIES: mechanosensitive ion channel domain-containing protein [Flavobacteriaceae]TEW76953.1 mechanosensitive ion channel [Gramella jeungdoensis]GGK59070.1 mechanosensitive ion channel protein MscS [Lutibacter litoralis]
METLNDILNFELFSLGKYTLKVSKLITILMVIVLTKLILWGIKKTLFRKKRFTTLDTGTSYAIFQIIKYVLYVIAIAFILESIGIKITILLAGSAALLVGVGLGLQQTFNDIISGLILLTERSIKINDILEVDGDIVKIETIGLRTSKALNRDDISIIIPNSLITTSKVINWSHQSQKARFKIDVGVAYGSDVDLVIKILEESAFEHPEVFNRELVEARLMNFGNSSLDFQLLFFSKNIFRIGKAKSDIRRIINKKFAENNISIPFPQMDVHFKSNNAGID